MKNFNLFIFYDKTKFLKEKSHNMITTENIWIWNCQRLVLRNEIVYKSKSRNKNF